MSNSNSIETDKRWYDEKGQEGRPLINHKGMMPKCFNCGGQYVTVVSDVEGKSKIEHPKRPCPFKQVFYGDSDFECVVALKKFNETMIARRNTSPV